MPLCDITPAMPSSVAVIRNPVSGRGKWQSRWPALEFQLKRIFPTLEVLETTRSGDAARLAIQCVGKGVDLVIAAGGDGTISQVGGQLVSTPATLGILPCGTGNDLARTLGVGPEIDLALSRLESGVEAVIDVGEWCSDTAEGFFLNVAGSGFDAAVADKINSGIRRLRGTPAYVAAVLSTLRSFRPEPVLIEVDDDKFEATNMLTAIANARCYGGGMKIAPRASVADGLLDIVLVKKVSKVAFLRAFPRVFKGEHLSHPAVTYRQAQKITLTSAGIRPFLIDGELIAARQVTLGIRPQSLKVRV